MPDLPSLLNEWVMYNKQVKDAEVDRFRIEQQMAEAMKEDRAEYVEAPGVQATFKPTTEYLKAIDGPLAVIAEQLSPDELSRVLNNPKPVARQFLIPAIKKLAKRGGVFRTALDKATLEQPPRLRVRSVE